MALTTTRTQLFNLKDVGVSCQRDRIRQLVFWKERPRRGADPRLLSGAQNPPAEDPGEEAQKEQPANRYVIKCGVCHSSTRRLRRHFRFVRDVQMSWKVAFFAYEPDEQASLRVFRLPHKGWWQPRAHKYRGLARPDAHSLKTALLRRGADAKRRRPRAHHSRSDTPS
jgi:hypothetical protein